MSNIPHRVATATLATVLLASSATILLAVPATATADAMDQAEDAGAKVKKDKNAKDRMEREYRKQTSKNQQGHDDNDDDDGKHEHQHDSGDTHESHDDDDNHAMDKAARTAERAGGNDQSAAMKARQAERQAIKDDYRENRTPGQEGDGPSSGEKPQKKPWWKFWNED